jgi:hypothetical protein
LDTQQQKFNKQRTQHHSIVKARFVVSEKIAKHSKSFGEGGFIKECLVDVASIICPEKKKITSRIFVCRDLLLSDG